jgi:hypothetical protein
MTNKMFKVAGKIAEDIWNKYHEISPFNMTDAESFIYFFFLGFDEGVKWKSITSNEKPKRYNLKRKQ